MNTLKNDRRILGVCLFAFLANLTLFFVKLYVGISSNSISIFSDAVNNLFDSLSGLLSLVCLGFIMRSDASSTYTVVKKSEQLLSFIMAIVVAAAGFVFAYSSLERLMYPTLVWFMTRYMTVLIGTAVAKILMFLFYRYEGKKASSPVIKVMSFDCILDFFITVITVMTLILSRNGSYAFDAVFGLVISAVIIVSAVKMIVSSAAVLINHVGADKREEIEKILSENLDNFEEISYYTDGEKTEAYVTVKEMPSEETRLEVKRLCLEKESILAVFALR